MQTAKIAVTIAHDLLADLDQLVREQRFPNRSRAIQEALREKLDRMKRGRLARECAKLSRDEEQQLAEEGMSEDGIQWPAY